MYTDGSRPNLTTALVCGEVKSSSDGEQLHAYGIARGAEIPAPPPGQFVNLRAALLIGFHHDGFVGEPRLRVELVRGSGARTELLDREVYFAPNEVSMSIVVDFHQVLDEGVNYFEVMLDGELISRVPFALKHI